MNPQTFRDRIRESIRDVNLQLALDNNATRRKDGRVFARHGDQYRSGWKIDGR